MRRTAPVVPTLLLLAACGAAAGRPAEPAPSAPSAAIAEPAPQVPLDVPRGVPIPDALTHAPPALRSAFARAAALATPLVSDQEHFEAELAAWQARAMEEIAAIDAETEPLLADPSTDDGARVVRAMARTLVLRVWNERLPQRVDDRLPEPLRWGALGSTCAEGPWQEACEEWQREAEWAIDEHADEDGLAERLRSLSLRQLPADPQGVARVHIASFSAVAYGALVDPTDAEIDAALRDRDAELRRAFEAVREQRDREGEAILVSAILLDEEAFVPEVGEDPFAEDSVTAEEGAARIFRRLAAGESFETLARRFSGEVDRHTGGRRDWMPVARLRAPFDVLAHAPCRGEVYPQAVPVRDRAWVLRCDARSTPPVTYEQHHRELARALLRREAGMVAARADAERVLAQLRAGHSWSWIEEQVTHAWGARDDADALSGAFIRTSYAELTPDDAEHPEAARAMIFASTEPFPDTVLEVGSQILVFEREAFVRQDAWSPDESTEQARMRVLLERMRSQ